ncbi:regulator of nonsense transcripts related protein [Cyclospora cayetanensis]|uniref:Regulator of nonsense transcripts related protein n=1 Tax=Cyclospora cayetanensis TaxID=88456 RepID=A0A1D3CYG7_9EIME|nr:regulator of nonsense transcripts related protein [Cyclospora cayetanensis]
MGSLQNGVSSADRIFPFVPRAWTFVGNKGGEEEEVATKADLGFFSPEQIGVITPYLGQRNFLRTLLQRNPMPAEVEISSVDAFQGREKDIIIFSCVRSNTQSSIGFLSDPRRLNVALTRARFCVFICGNASLLSIQRTPSSGSSAALPPSLRGAPSGPEDAEGERGAPPSGQGPSAPPSTCKLLQMAASQFLETLPVWPLLVLHYEKQNCIVSGPICNLREVQFTPTGRKVPRSFNGATTTPAPLQAVSTAGAKAEEAPRAPVDSGGPPDYPLAATADPAPVATSGGSRLAKEVLRFMRGKRGVTPNANSSRLHVCLRTCEYLGVCELMPPYENIALPLLVFEERLYSPPHTGEDVAGDSGKQAPETICVLLSVSLPAFTLAIDCSGCWVVSSSS